MIGFLVIPSVDTERGTFHYQGKLDRETYDEMVDEHFRQTDRQVRRFIDNMENGISNVRSHRGMYDLADLEKIPQTYYKYHEAEAFIQDSRRRDIPESDIRKHLEDGKMFILIVNIKPKTLDEDSETELKFWLDDSRRVHEDRMLDTRIKMLRLPPRDLKLKLGEEYATLHNCKVLENYGNEYPSRNPYHFAFIVEKITME